MVDFDDVREGLGDARRARELASARVAAANERLRRATTRETALLRRFDVDNQAHLDERKLLLAERASAEADVQAMRDQLLAARAREAGIGAQFAAFTDPRVGITRLADDTPILLLPVRLETRYKTVATPGAPQGQPQLWVRVFPDDCWLDSFDATLTETEVAGAVKYWEGIWSAGGFEDQERGAWRVLATSHGSGRAAWIVSQYTPVNLATKPVKANAEDVILTISCTVPLTAAASVATTAFWSAAWLANGQATAADAALAGLEAAVGSARAAEIIATYAPANFSVPLPGGVERNDVSVSVAFVVLPVVVTKQAAWSSAPKFNILPERFAFLGYQNGSMTTFALGNTVASPLYAGPDPSAPAAEQLRHDADGNLTIPDELLWLSDFDRAVAVGMGFRIPLDATQASGGFDRVLVIGLRVGADAPTVKTELETLLRHHSFSRKGLAVVPQGTPTNNTEATPSGATRLDDPDESFDDLRSPLFTETANWLDKRDGQWIAEYIGVDAKLFEHVHHAGATDQAAARAINSALWPATLGYWMETMMSPVFTADGIEQTRDFFNRYVVAGGAVPALRIGQQPYGILPATAISRMRWFSQDGAGVDRNAGAGSKQPFLARLYSILRVIEADWRIALSDVSSVGKPGDPHKILLDIVGLHSGSVEWAERYAESLATVFNRLNLLGFGGMIQAIILSAQRAGAAATLGKLGAVGAHPPILDLLFSGKDHALTGGVVDDTPLSETKGVREYTDTKENYIRWLIDAARESLDALYRQDGFKDDRPPTALLYLFLRHALQLGYHDVSVRLHESTGLYTADAARRARADDPFLHIRTASQVSESRYQPLYTSAPAITGDALQPVHEFIALKLPTLTLASRLRDQLAALERLATEPTARLERVFADHLDCGAYRLDAWLLGIVNHQLASMRNLHDAQQVPPRQGSHLGAYAWLEDLRPENKVMTPVVLDDPDLAAQFNDAADPPLMRDATNQGYVHAPSLNHAVAAAVLRNGFISNASAENGELLAVNLTSERVRTALGLLEGIRGGQSLSDLLGYQFERGLHDRHGLAEVDKFIYDLRKAFPLRADRLKSTQTGEGVPIQAIEARNVIDGLALAEQIKRTGIRTYPFGKDGLPPIANLAEAAAIDAEADRLADSHDAVADLALSEGVYQAVLGNYDRVASTYDSYARGNFPPEPDIARTPLNGVGITHRVGLHLDASASPDVSPVAGITMTPRAQGEPSLNSWLASIMPSPDQVGCTVTFREAASGATLTREITMDALDQQPADLLVMIHEGDAQAMSELDDRLVRHAYATFGPRPDTPVTIAYMGKALAPYSVFEISALVRNVRRLVTQSRPLVPTDLSLGNEASAGHDAGRVAIKVRLDRVHDAMELLRDDVDAFVTRLRGPLSDLATRRGEILADVDDYVDDAVELLARAAAFTMPEAGWGFAYDFRRRFFSMTLAQADALVQRWDDKLVQFQALLVEEAALPLAAPDDARYRILVRAESAIATTVTAPLPATPALYRSALVAIQEAAFVTRRDAFATLAATTRTRVVPLLADVEALLPVTAFDAKEYALTPLEDEMVRFTEDALRIARSVLAELDRRLATAAARFTDHDDAAQANARVTALEDAAKALLSAGFRIVPVFDLPTAQGNEIENALTASRSGDLFEHLTNPPDPSVPVDDFPVDTWLYGIARVREKMTAWEQTVMFTGGFGLAEPELDAMQLPFIPGDHWMGLEFPAGQALDRERLLYTAHFAVPFDKTVRQCGLLLDEWTETIPTADVDTGITFHHDRPNNEAPQAMLLALPTAFRGAWEWNDLVDALHDTLELAKLRAIEPRHVDALAYAPFLPSAITASQVSQLTIAMSLAMNNSVARALGST